MGMWACTKDHMSLYGSSKTRTLTFIYLCVSFKDFYPVRSNKLQGVVYVWFLTLMGRVF